MPYDSTLLKKQATDTRPITIILLSIRQFLAFLLLALLPFHAFTATVGRNFFGESFYLRSILTWKEVLAIAFIGLCFSEIIIKVWPEISIQKIKKYLKIDFLDVTLLGFIALGLLYGVFQETSLGQWANGFRIDVLPFSLVFFARKVHWQKENRIVQGLLIIGFLVSILGILQALIIPEKWLAWLGYAENIITDIPGIGALITGTTKDALQACPPLEHTSQFCRAISTFGGPTRFGTYLLVIIGLYLGLGIRQPLNKAKIRFIMVFFSLIALFLTYSRSVWLGFIGILSIWAWIRWRKKAVIISSISIALVVFLGIFAWNIRSSDQHNNPLKSIIARVSSTQKHFEYMQNGIQVVYANPLGHGLGTAGAASVRYKSFLTENWFLQIFVEMGIMGGILFIVFIMTLLIKLFKAHTPFSLALFLGLIGVSVTGLFTHSFEELATSYTLMLLAGIFTQQTERPSR